jgi:hypothetical protein
MFTSVNSYTSSDFSSCTILSETSLESGAQSCTPLYLSTIVLAHLVIPNVQCLRTRPSTQDTRICTAHRNAAGNRDNSRRGEGLIANTSQETIVLLLPVRGVTSSTYTVRLRGFGGGELCFEGLDLVVLLVNVGAKLLGLLVHG